MYVHTPSMSDNVNLPINIYECPIDLFKTMHDLRFHYILLSRLIILIK